MDRLTDAGVAARVPIHYYVRYGHLRRLESSARDLLPVRLVAAGPAVTLLGGGAVGWP
jgi:hypothetical protein